MLGVNGSTGILRECQAVLYLFNYLLMYLFSIHLFIYLLAMFNQAGLVQLKVGSIFYP